MFFSPASAVDNELELPTFLSLSLFLPGIVPMLRAISLLFLLELTFFWSVWEYRNSPWKHLVFSVPFCLPVYCRASKLDVFVVRDASLWVMSSLVGSLFELPAVEEMRYIHMLT